MTLLLHGETVQVTAIECVPRGYYTEYKAYIHFLDEHGKPVNDHKPIHFNESVAKTFRDAGYEKVTYTFSQQRIVMPYVDVILDGTGKRLSISHVFSPNATAYEATDNRTASYQATQKHAAYAGMSISEQMGAAQAQKKQEREAARWGNGVALHQYQRTNEYALIEVNGEFQLVKHERKAAA